MTVWETLLVFGVVPLGLFGLLALLSFGPGAASRAPRYRPGRPWQHEPVWYVAHPEVVEAGRAAAERPALPGSANRPELSAPAGPASVLDAPVHTAKGGASGKW